MFVRHLFLTLCGRPGSQKLRCISRAVWLCALAMLCLTRPGTEQNRFLFFSLPHAAGEATAVPERQRPVSVRKQPAGNETGKREEGEHQKTPQQKPGKKKAAGKNAEKNAVQTAGKVTGSGEERLTAEERFVVQPYRVYVSVAFTPSAELLPLFRRRFLQELSAALQRSYGRMWDASIRENDWLSPNDQRGLQLLSPDDLSRRFPSTRRAGAPRWDKVFLLLVEPRGPHFLLAAREFDLREQRLTPVLSKTAFQRSELREAALELLSALFQPVLQITSVRNNVVQLRLRAAAYPPLESSLRQVKQGDVITPYFRYYDKNNVVQRIQTLPWTYIVVDEVDREYIRGSLVSAFRSPLGTARTRRVELLGRRVQPLHKESRLRMVYQTDETRPLVGYRVQLVRKLFPRQKSSLPPTDQFSGRDGYITIPVDARHPITWIYVYSGNALLARVPYAAGVSAQETLSLPDDSIRLAVEGRIELLKGRLIDTIARRATLKALAIRVYYDAGLSETQRRQRLQELLGKLADLDKPESNTSRTKFLEELSLICRPSLAAAEQLGNRFARRRIQRMYTKTEELIQRYLPPQDTARFRQELFDGKFGN